MKRLVGALAVVVFVLGIAGLASGQNDDPRIGTWKLNLAKSKIDGQAPKSQTRTDELSSDGKVEAKVERVNQDGSKTTYSMEITPDGKPHPSVAPGGAESSSTKRVGNKFIGTATKSGKVLFTVTEVVSKDGKTLTVALKGTSGDGLPMNSVFVYDKE